MQRLFYLNCLLKNIGIRLSCHQNSQLNHSLALVTKNNEIVFLHLYDQAEPEIICVPWITQSDRRIEAICLNPTSDWLLTITENNSLYVVPTFRSAGTENKDYPKWPTSDVTAITEAAPCTSNNSKPLKLLWWQRKNSNQNAFIGYEDGTIRLVCLENGGCLDTCKVTDQIRSLNLCPNQSRNRISLLVQGESGQKWSSTLERQFIGSVWEKGVNCRKPLHFQPLELVNEDIPEFSPFKSCVICAITEQFNSLISKPSECNFNSGELDLSVDVLQAHFTFFKNERVLHIYKIMDNDCFNDKNYNVTSSGVRPNFFPSLIENFKLAKSPIEGYLVVTDFGVYKISLSSFVIDQVISLVMDDKFGLAARLAIIFGLNLAKLLESCGDLMIAHDATHEGLKMYRNARINPLTKISKMADNTEALLKFCRIYLTTHKNTMATTDKIYVTNVIVMAYVQIISKPDEELKYKKFEDDFLNFIRHEEFYDGSLIFRVTCKFRLWNVASLLAVTHGLQNELVTALAQTITDPPPLNDTNFLTILSDPDLTLSLLVQPESCNTILRFVRKNLRNFPLGILERFVNQLDLSKICNVFEMTMEDQTDHRREMIETFILLVMQLVDQTKTSCYNTKLLLQKLTPVEASNRQNLNQFGNFATLSCGYKYAAVIRNDQIYTMGDSTSGSLGVGPTEKQNNPPKVCKTLDALNVVVWSVSCGRKHTLALTDSGVFSWGSNAYGQLGISALNRKSPYPTLVSSLNDEQIVAVVAGQYHSMVLTVSGCVYTWGWGIHGQLGHGSSNNEYLPRLLRFNHSVVKIASGYAHSLVLTSEGKLYGFGSNIFGQLARKNLYGNKSSVPIQIVILCNGFIPFRDIAAGYFQSVAIREKDELLYIWGATPKYLRSRRSKSVKTPKGRPLKRGKSPICVYSGLGTNPIKKIVVGLHHIVMLHCGILYVCKDMEETFTMVKTNEQNNCGKFTTVSCGSDFTLARSKTGRLFFWGNEIVAKTLMGKSYNNAQEETARLSNRFQSHLGSNPEEIRGLPSIVITYHPVGHSFKFPKSVLRSTNGKFEQETLLLILETYFGHYDTQNVISECLGMDNFPAASKVAILNKQFEDSFGYQLRTMESGKLFKFSFAELREDTATESWKILMNLVEFYIECTASLECKIHTKNIINMSIEFWINHELPVTTFEVILEKNMEKLLHTLFNIVFCEHSSNNFHEEMNENDDDDKKLRNHKFSQFLNSLSSKFKLQLCSSIVKYVDH